MREYPTHGFQHGGLAFGGAPILLTLVQRLGPTEAGFTVGEWIGRYQGTFRRRTDFDHPLSFTGFQLFEGQPCLEEFCPQDGQRIRRIANRF